MAAYLPIPFGFPWWKIADNWVVHFADNLSFRPNAYLINSFGRIANIHFYCENNEHKQITQFKQVHCISGKVKSQTKFTSNRDFPNGCINIHVTNK